MQDANWTEQLVAVTVGVFYFTQKGKKCKHLNLKKKWSVFLFLKDIICIYKVHTSRETSQCFM